MEALDGKKQLYGVSAVNATKNMPFTVIKNFFTIQPWKFWFSTYIFAIILFYITNQFHSIYYILNTLLFPFSCMLLGKIANFFNPSVRFIHAILYPGNTDYLRTSFLLTMLIIYVLKFFLYAIVWSYSFAIGIIGLIVTIIDVKNLSK